MNDLDGEGAFDPDGLGSGELAPAEGGQWSGLLFDNPRIGLAPQLTWTFTFPFREVVRDYGDSPVELTLEWVPLPASAWHAMTGASARSATFGERGEASVYFFTHHRYAGIDLGILDQRGLMVHARAAVSGDLDGLGPGSLTADAWLRFAGISVSLSDSHSAGTAWSRLREFTDTTGLSPTPAPRHNSFLFVAATP